MDFALLDADSSGSLVEDRARHLVIGYDAAGVERWRVTQPKGAGEVVCLRACPDAVLSSTGATLLQYELPDPPVLFRLGNQESTQRAGESLTGTAGKTTVWAALSPTQAVLQESDLTGRSAMVLRSPGQQALIDQVPLTARVFVNERVDHALVTAATDGRAVDYWYALNAAGRWQRMAVTNTAISFACLSADGQSVLYAGPRGVVLARFGMTQGAAIAGAADMADCGWSAPGPVLARSNAQDSTALVALDSTGRPIWRAVEPGLGGVSVSAAGDHAVVRGPGQVFVLDRRGQLIRRFDGVAGALAASADQVVWLDDHGHPHRLALHSA